MNRLLVHATRPSKTAFEKCGPRGHLRTGTTTRRPHAALTRTSPAVDDFCHALIGQWIPPAVTASKSRSSIGFIKAVLPRTHLESGPNDSRLYVRFEDDCQGIANDVAVCSYLPTLLQISPDGRRILRRSVSCAPHSPSQEWIRASGMSSCSQSTTRNMGTTESVHVGVLKHSIDDGVDD